MTSKQDTMTTAADATTVRSPQHAVSVPLTRFELRALWRQRLVPLTAAALIVVLVAATFTVLSRRSADGPLLVPNEHGWVLDKARVGQRFTDGLETLTFAGDTPVEIHDIRSIGGGRGLRLVGARVAGDDRAVGATQYVAGFPPRGGGFGRLQAAHGAVLAPRPGPRYDAWELLLGYRVLRAGAWERTAVEIEYSAGGRRYIERIPAHLVVCAGRRLRACSEDAGDPGF